MVRPLAMAKPVSPLPALPGMAPKLKEKPSPVRLGSAVGEEMARSKEAVKAETTREASRTGRRRRVLVEMVPSGGVAVVRRSALFLTAMMVLLKKPLTMP